MLSPLELICAALVLLVISVGAWRRTRLTMASGIHAAESVPPGEAAPAAELAQVPGGPVAPLPAQASTLHGRADDLAALQQLLQQQRLCQPADESLQLRDVWTRLRDGLQRLLFGGDRAVLHCPGNTWSSG